MHIVAKHRWSLLLTIVVTLAVFTGRLAAATYRYDLSAALRVWDLTGIYDGADFGFISTPLTVVQDANGKLRSSGLFDTISEGDRLIGIYTVTGSVTQKADTLRVKMTIRLKGVGSNDLGEYKFTGAAIIRGEVDPEALSIVGTAKVSTKVAGERERWSQAFEAALPDGMTGASRLTVDIEEPEDKGKKRTGTATLELSNGDTYTFSGWGVFSPRRNEDGLVLSSSEKFNLYVYVNPTTGRLDRVKGLVLGQKVEAEGVMPSGE